MKMLEKNGRLIASWSFLIGSIIVVYSGYKNQWINFTELQNGSPSLTSLALLFPLAFSVFSIVFFACFDTIKSDGIEGMGVWFSGKLMLLYTALYFAFDHSISNMVFGIMAVLSLLNLLSKIAGDDDHASVSRPDTLSKDGNVQAVKAALSNDNNGVYCGDISNNNERFPLHISTQDRGIVIGPPGTGKTAFMVTQLLDWAEKKGSFICLDIKPELDTILKERLDELGYKTLVFNPSVKSDRYNLLDDLVGATAIGELAGSLVPSSSDSDTRAFDEGARDILDGIICYLRSEKRPVSLPAMREFLGQFTSETDLIKVLSQSKDPDVRDIAFSLARSAKNSRFIGSVFATLRANLRFLRYESVRDSIGKSDFSLRCFLDDQPVALFLQFEERHQEVTRLLLTAMISHIFTYFIEHTDRSPVLLMLDEVGNAPKIPGLVEKLNTIRSRKLPTWMYWQGIQQMQKYGQQANEGSNSIMAACDFHMAFRLNDNDSAKWFSERIGTTDREVRSSSSGTGRSSTGKNSSDNVTYQVQEEQILKTAELQALPFSESVAIYRGMVWKNHATPYFERWPEMAKNVEETQRR